jgi:hypothetical protein
MVCTHSLFPSDSHDEIVPTKIAVQSCKWNHRFEQEEEEVQTSLNCEGKTQHAREGLKKTSY